MMLLLVLLITSNMWVDLVHSSTFHTERQKRDNAAFTQPPTVLTKWFDQKFDHNDKNDNRTWKQRYFVNSENFAKGGPVFLFIGGEGEALARWLAEGTMYEFSKTYKALMLLLEHRFYGESHPTPDKSVENLKYLSTVQALEDIAVFIKAMNKEYTQTSGRWVLFGGSYPGSLVAWARARFPDLIYASVASSAPVNPVVDNLNYFAVVANALNKTNPNCLESFRAAQNQLNQMLQNSAEQQKLSEMLRLCNPIDPSNKDDVHSLFQMLSSHVSAVAQYNEDSSFDKRIRLANSDVCKMVTGSPGDKSTPIERLAQFNRMALEHTNRPCLEYSYTKNVENVRNTSLKAKVSRSWAYQTCKEIGCYQTSTLPLIQQLFGEFPVDLFLRQCKEVFGEKFDVDYIYNGIRETVRRYGGLSYKMDRVVFVHGTGDPWHVLGITKSSDPRMPVVLIPDTAHCADMFPPSKKDLPQLVEARKQVSSYINQWLKE